jgi:hypothetical protein
VFAWRMANGPLGPMVDDMRAAQDGGDRDSGTDYGFSIAAMP